MDFLAAKAGFDVFVVFLFCLFFGFILKCFFFFCEQAFLYERIHAGGIEYPIYVPFIVKQCQNSRILLWNMTQIKDLY